jgi:hypothetical protein
MWSGSDELLTRTVIFMLSGNKLQRNSFKGREQIRRSSFDALIVGSSQIHSTQKLHKTEVLHCAYPPTK